VLESGFAANKFLTELKFKLMKKTLLFLLVGTLIYSSCDEQSSFNSSSDGAKPVKASHIKKYPGDLAVSWMKLQMAITRVTPGFNAARAFAYSGLTLYESLVEGMPGYKSVASYMMGSTVQPSVSRSIYFPASANAAMALILKDLIPTASAASLAKIDSLESVFNIQFGQEAPNADLEASIHYGRSIASSIFEWCKTDGAAEAAAKNPSYDIPEGFGLWKPTPPAFLPPVNVYASEIRPFVVGSALLTLPPPPIPYSEEAGSPFYNQANYIYTVSKSLTHYDSITVKTWGEFPGNYFQALRYCQIAIQLLDESDLSLETTAVAFAKHGMALQEATNCIFKAKYTYNNMRPITYIREVIGDETWNTLNTTPPHPEYPAAHACVGRASSRILESILGKHYGFTDRTHESLYGTRTYNSLVEYSDEAGLSRILGGIHYPASVAAGKIQGEKVADLVNKLPFRSLGNSH
jgi:hypothetical protein